MVGKFIEQLNYSFTNGGMTCAFTDKELSKFMLFLKDECRLSSIPKLKAATCIRRQIDDSVWVMNSETMIDENGQMVTADECKYIWLDESHTCMPDAILPSIQVLPQIMTPLTTNPMFRMMELLVQCTKHNYLSSLLAVAGVLMSFHYERIVELWGGCPIVVLLKLANQLPSQLD